MLLFQKMSRLCFNKCITKPGSSLDSTEQVNNILLIFLYILKITIQNFHFFLEMCFNVYGPLYGDSELSF